MSAMGVRPETETAACPHCRVPRREMVDGLHLPPDRKTPALSIGQTVIALRDTGVCSRNEPGIVVEEYRLGIRAGMVHAIRLGWLRWLESL